MAAIAFTPAPSSDSPNLRTSSNDQALRVFHHLIELCFASIRRWNPSTELVLVTTADPDEPLRSRLAALAVSVLRADFSHRPPAGFYPSFNASLYSVDAMQALATSYAPEDRIALLDPDIVCSTPLDELFAAIPDRGFLVYDTGFPADEVSQGLSARAAGRLHQVLDPGLSGLPRHYGGELYGFAAASWTQIAGRVDDAWAFSLEQWTHGEARFVTEEHLLNFALRYTDIVPAHRFVRRIWTASTYRTVRPADAMLPLWHLPAEKNRGLRRLHSVAADAASWFWTEPQPSWVRLASGVCGVAGRSPARWARDVAGSTGRRLQRIHTSA